MAVARPNSKRKMAIESIQALVVKRFPDARFRVTALPDSRNGTAVWTYTNADWEEVRTLIGDREIDLLVDQNVFISVIPMPLETYED